MRFFYDEFSGREYLFINDERLKHFKARRHKLNDRLKFRNLNDGLEYIYEIIEFDKKGARLNLILSYSVPVQNFSLTLAWAIIDSKIIEKNLAFLNEIGVGKIIFFYSKFSQRNFKIDLERFRKICILSSQQCGRNCIINFEIYKNIDEFLDNYPNAFALDFSGENIDFIADKDSLFAIGPEGGFSDDELCKFKNSKRLLNQNVLRSETAIKFLASKLI